MPQHDEKGTKQTPRQPSASEMPSIDDMLQTVTLTGLKRLKVMRDELDIGVPKILSLNTKERNHLAGLAVGAEGLVAIQNGESSWLAPRNLRNTDGELKDQKRLSLLRSFAMFVRLDTDAMAPEGKKAYEADLVKMWRDVKASLNELLEAPAIRKLLEPKVKTPLAAR